MDNRAAFIYMRDVRDLEVTVHVLSQTIRDAGGVESAELEAKGASHIWTLVLGLALAAVGAVLLLGNLSPLIDGLGAILPTVLLCIAFTVFIVIIFLVGSYIIGGMVAFLFVGSLVDGVIEVDVDALADPQATVLGLVGAVALVVGVVLAVKWFSRRGDATRRLDRLAPLNDRLGQARALLRNYYALDLLPERCRTLSCACWVYDYLANHKGDASLTDALLHERLEDGSSLVEAKLEQTIKDATREVIATRDPSGTYGDDVREINKRQQLVLEALEAVASEHPREAEEADLYQKLRAYNAETTELLLDAGSFLG